MTAPPLSKRLISETLRDFRPGSIAVAVLDGYKRWISPLLPAACRFTPDLLRVRASRLRAPRILARRAGSRCGGCRGAIPSIRAGSISLDAARRELSPEDRFGSEATHPGGVPVPPRSAGLVVPLPAAEARSRLSAAARASAPTRGSGGRWHRRAAPSSTSTEADAGGRRAEAIAAAAEQRVEVDTKRWPRGVHATAAPSSSRTASTTSPADDGQPLEMVRARGRGPYPFALTDPAGAPLPLNDALFAVEGPERGPTGTSQVVRFEYSGDAGRRDQGVSLPRQRSDRGGHPGRRQRAPGACCWARACATRRRRSSMSSSLFRGGLLPDGRRARDPSRRRSCARRFAFPAPACAGSALEDTYFLSMIAPKTPVSGVALQPVWSRRASAADRRASCRGLRPSR